MKPFLVATILLGSTFFIGCARESHPLAEEAGQDLQRGITGQGTLYERQNPDDPFIDQSAR